MTSKVLKFTLMAFSLFFTISCQNGVLTTVQQVTYPPDFNYISKDKLTTTMQTFAWYAGLLDNSFRDARQVTEEQRQNAIHILEKMEDLSLELATQSLSSNHHMISFNIDQFRQNIINARNGLQQDPPNYYLAGSVSAYCLNCHSLGKHWSE